MKKILFLMMLSVLVSCAKKERGDILIMFIEQERDVDAYQTRMIVTKNFMRLDDGAGSNSFVLFDRLKRVVYSVDEDEKSVMSVQNKEIKKIESPLKLTHSIKEMEKMQDAPEIGGKKAKHYQLITNDKVCYDVVAVKGLMPDAVKALNEFHAHMAKDSVVTFDAIPADMYDACAMSITTFAPTRHLQFGFPIKEWGKRDYVRTLVDFDTNYKADAKLFLLPKDYNNYSVQELREGKVDFSN